MYPPGTGKLSKEVPKEGNVINGLFIPGGTQITPCMYGLQHKKSFWGADADVFRPERWIEADGERLSDMYATTDLVFGSGKSQCLGKSVAYTELSKALVEVSPITDRAKF